MQKNRQTDEPTVQALQYALSPMFNEINTRTIILFDISSADLAQDKPIAFDTGDLDTDEPDGYNH
jgi:hypothetical protein